MGGHLRAPGISEAREGVGARVQSEDVQGLKVQARVAQSSFPKFSCGRGETGWPLEGDMAPRRADWFG